jgi:hypothetical protein
MRLAPNLFLGCFFASAPIIAACSGSSATPITDTSDAGSHRDGASREDASSNAATCETFASAACAVLARCSPDGTSLDYGSASTCETRVEIQCNAALSAKGSSRTAAQDLSCAKAEATENCTTFLNGIAPSACNATPGSATTGTACTYDAQCASAYCALQAASACGTCQPAPSAGDSCANLTSCGPALTCYHATCVAFVASGATCGPTDPCGAGLSCVTAKNATTGTCKEEGATLGAACDPRLETAASCDPTQELYCVHLKGDPNLHTCQKVSLAKSGQACGDVAGVTALCSDASTCVKSTADGGVSGTCVARAADGADCDTVTGPACMSPARCIGTLLDGGTRGKCTLPGTTTCP